MPRILISFLALAILIPAYSKGGRLMQGPMVGSIESNKITLWARTASECAINIRYSSHPNFLNARLTSSVFASAEEDYCVTVTVDNLEPNSFYYYQVLVDGEPIDYDGYPVLTAPEKEMLTKFSIGFGSGARADHDGLQAIWLQVKNA